MSLDYTTVSGTWTAPNPDTAGGADYTLVLNALQSCSLTGSMTAVSPNTHVETAITLQGRIDPGVRPSAGPDAGYALGWVLAPRVETGLEHSTTMWNALYFPSTQRIVAQWVVVASTTPGEAWGSANVGSVVYTRGRTGLSKQEAAQTEEQHVTDVPAEMLRSDPEASDPETAAAALDYTRLKGTWYNELGSWMLLSAWPQGSLVGLYNSKKGDASAAYELRGRFDVSAPVAEGMGLSFGWAVGWNNAAHGDSYSASTWVGQLFLGPTPEDDVITTQWLLGVSTAPEKIWAATMLGGDVFTRGAPKAALAATVPRVSVLAHPSIDKIVEKGEAIANM
ncbi:Streptavidin [Mycena indigotica]|uniref:Streptavidin n=1 Tax=Mycena indigotica TaxID=2126181 RepID=A0A8H6S2N3_9AGAR|nr:Streptavidin [Mycena indigotica]KAF7290727.1 Streptavidin [Mycena indigotica]